MYSSEAPEADCGGPGGGSGGPGAGSDVGPQGPSATWGFATPPFSRPDYCSVDGVHGCERTREDLRGPQKTFSFSLLEALRAS